MTSRVDERGTNARRAGSTSAVWGHVIVLMAAASFILSMYMMFFSKLTFLLEDSTQERDGGSILEAIEHDVYYCYLIPLTIPVSILAFYANWVSLKFFRHN
ncbi:hypothetical protein Poli38472_010931 [Pythium oligandrum]|uniref:Uncharacterized protein n=1 Tax=Pythium oligandrum TaxID=41045 RepID=A0A8K1CG19_PYTOL|nr:hypothetical protein Poli38472_010931 [Pythium oligandrum]|eukprot:TMW61868.1 hypothetical protein Poli38472_010931 [Pythium oligandrum]